MHIGTLLFCWFTLSYMIWISDSSTMNKCRCSHFKCQGSNRWWLVSIRRTMAKCMGSTGYCSGDRKHETILWWHCLLWSLSIKQSACPLSTYTTLHIIYVLWHLYPAQWHNLMIDKEYMCEACNVDGFCITGSSRSMFPAHHLDNELDCVVEPISRVCMARILHQSLATCASTKVRSDANDAYDDLNL